VAYCTIDDILERIDASRLVQLTDDEGSGSVNAERVAQAIADADEEIDGYAGARYAVPLDPAPGVVRKLSADIAIYNLYGRRDKVPEARAERYGRAVQTLEKIAAGKFSLGSGDPEGNPPGSSAPEMAGGNPRRVFSRDGMRGF
jgi:phage gp36-like protein